MAWYELKSDVTIGSFRFSGVHEVRVRRGIHGYVDWAMIKIPSIGKVQQGRLDDYGNVVVLPGTSRMVTTGSLFTDGDPVSIKLGYAGKDGREGMKEVFRGFVKRRNLNMPLEVECEGYVRQLRLNCALNGSYKKTSAKELLLLACENTDIAVQCPVDFPLSGIKLQDADGTKIIDHIKHCSDNTLTVFFLKPDVLWCGLVYTPYLAGSLVYDLPTVNYRLGWNVIKDNGLKERIASEPVQIIINGKLANGDTVRTESKDKMAKRKVKFLLNNVPDSETLKKFAQEKQLTSNYTGYEGDVNTFLEPWVEPGYSAKITDTRYPERNGTYLIESTELSFGVKGARIRAVIGPKLS